MNGSIEIGTCDICKKKQVQVNRTYYHYNLRCLCHSYPHFEIVKTCNSCKPAEPKLTKITIRTENLEKCDAYGKKL